MLTINLFQQDFGTLFATQTFSEVLRAWLASKRSSWCPRHVSMMRLFGRAWSTVLGTIRIAEVRPIDVQLVFIARDNGRAATTLNGERRWFKAFWSWAVELELAPRNPMVRAAWPRKHGPRCRVYIWLTQEQEEALLRSFRRRNVRHYKRLVPFAIRTGLRAGELRRLVWAWIVPGETGWMLSIAGRSRKSSLPLVVPLSKAAVEILGPRGDPGALVFPNLPSNTNIARALRHAARRAGLPPHIAENLSMHQLRRTFRERLRRAGLSTRQVADLGGWASEEVVDGHYTCDLSENEARSYLERI